MIKKKTPTDKYSDKKHCEKRKNEDEFEKKHLPSQFFLIPNSGLNIEMDCVERRERQS